MYTYHQDVHFPYFAALQSNYSESLAYDVLYNNKGGEKKKRKKRFLRRFA